MTKDLVIFRCASCIKDFNEYNPYVYRDKSRVPYEKIEIVEVPFDFCENVEFHIHHKPQLQAPIFINKKIPKPWKVRFWENPDERNQGISSEFGSYESFNEAFSETVASARTNNWAAAEIYLDIGRKQIPVYLHDAEEPDKSTFIIH